MEGDQKTIRGGLDKLKSSEKLDLMISDLSVIEKETLLDTVATYSYIGTSKGEKTTGVIQFVKDEKGVWRIKSL